ncbi:hypothetical protein LCGC14_2521420, partial [marine sediment metagenome]
SRDALLRTLTAYSGITTGDGAGDGTTLVDTKLIDNALISPSGIPEKTILILSGDARGEDKGSVSFNNGTGAITLQGTGFSAQIKAGTIYRILNISSIEIDVANIDTKIGTNVDAAGTTTLFAWLVKLFEQGGQGGFYYGKVTQVDDATHFRVSSLTGFGDAYFANNYRVYVVRDAAGGGAAPQGEMQPCSVYASTDAIFTHTAFTAGLAVDDEVLLIHERIAEIADLLADVGDASGSTLGSIYAILGNPAQTFLAMIGYEGATSLADKLTAARAALIDEITALRMAELDAANIPADIDTLLTRLSAVRAGYLDELDFDLQATLATIAGYLDAEIAAILAAVDTEVAAILADTGTDGVVVNSRTAAYGRLAGVEQMAPTTIDLNQAAATYDLFTGTAQVVILESLNIKMPTGAAGGALTSISIQTDDATAGVIINPTDGAVANLTSEADLGWTGTLYITAGTKIRLTIAGGAHGSAYVCNVTAKCRAVVAGG